MKTVVLAVVQNVAYYSKVRFFSFNGIYLSMDSAREQIEEYMKKLPYKATWVWNEVYPGDLTGSFSNYWINGLVCNVATHDPNYSDFRLVVGEYEITE